MSTVERDSDILSEKRRKVLELLLDRNGAHGQTNRIRPRPSSITPPLSFAQQRLWFLDKLVPQSPFYNVPAAVRVQAPLNVDVLKKTLNEIVKRHEVLRTSFGEANGQPFQIIAPHVEVPFTLHDLRDMTETVREREAVRLATEDAQQPFDLRHSPLIRSSVVWMGEHDYFFLINLHHIVADGWSMGVLIDEFKRLYGAFLLNLPSPLPALEIQYADFAVWQQKHLSEGRLQNQLNYWTSKLANLPLLELPTDYPHRTVQDFEGETLFITLPLSLSEQLKAFSQSNGVTLFATLFAAFNALLHRYTGQDEIIIGEPVANRNRLELEPLIGFFVNSLVLRTDVSDDPTFRELLHRSRQVILDADAHQDVPFEVLVERLKPERSMGRNPLFQVSLQFFSGIDAGAGNRHSTSTSTSTLAGEVIHVDKGTASLDLAFDLIDSEQGILARVEYSTELFRQDTIKRLVRHYQNLLQAFTSDPDLRVSNAPMLDADETHRLLANWNPPATQASFVHVQELFESQVRRSPEAIAVECDDCQLSYRQLNGRVNRLARKFQTHGVGAEKLVAICLDRSPRVIEAILAVWKAGGAYTPLDPSLPDERFRFLLSNAKPCLVLTERLHAHRLNDCELPVILCEDEEENERDAALSDEDLLPTSGAENLAYVIYTSGSSGTPKGVMIEHGALSRHLQWMQAEFTLRPGDRTLFKYSFNFDVSIIEMFAPLIAGAWVVVLGGDGIVDIAKLAKLIREREITVIDMVPSMLAALLDQPFFVASRSLRRVTCGGEVMPSDLLNRLNDKMNVEFVNMYGPTEATISATFWRHKNSDASKAIDVVPIGRPAAPCTAYVLDRYLNPLPTGVPGELYLGGSCLARGYNGRSDLTQERFVRDPFSGNSGNSGNSFARLYRTGDRCVFQPDGNLEFKGRIDDQVKLRGYRIELGELEAVLAENPHVRACAAVVRQDRGRHEIIGYVVPNTSEPEFFPSIGEYFIYDELLYHVMTTDRVRTRAYRSAIERTVGGKVVIDVGTGADLALARMCLESGAKRVYAVEMLDHAYERARRLARELNLQDRLMLLHGDSREIELPEKVDVCVSELIGTIGSSEGVIEILNDARRFLKPYGEMMPLRCVTKIAAISLPDELRLHPEFKEIPKHYAEKVFESRGQPFDIRVCVKNLPANCLVSDAAIFEELHFDRTNELEQSTEIRLTIRRKCRVDGFLLWINLYPGSEEIIEVLTSECSWLPIFFPVFDLPVELNVGDTITAVCARLSEPGEFTPDYLIRGAVSRKGASEIEFKYESRRNEIGYRSNSFYQNLFKGRGSDDPEPMKADARKRVAEWRGVYEQLYGNGSDRQPAPDPEFDITGWDSSYTGLPLTPAEMHEQVAATVGRIRALGGSRILEVGCGTGLLLLRLAGAATRYVGTDFSRSVLTRLAREVARHGWQQVELMEREAADFSGFASASFDVVVLNSVVQYFPGVEYLRRVLEGACRVVREGGYVFVGDVRSLPLQEMLAAGIEVARHTSHGSSGAHQDELRVGELRERIAQWMRREPETVLSPELFRRMPEYLREVTNVAVEVKRGRFHNELTRFRYDVVLEVSGAGAAVVGGAGAGVGAEEVEERQWSEMGGVEGMAAYLAERAGKALARLVVRSVPSRRVAWERRLLGWLAKASAEASLEEFEKWELDVNEVEGVEAEELWELEGRVPYRVQVTWADEQAQTAATAQRRVEGSAAVGGYDVVCVRREETARSSAGAEAKRSPVVWSLPLASAGEGEGEGGKKPWALYSNRVEERAASERASVLAQELREHLRARVPEYMVPAAFVWLEALPLTANGKLDRRALPAPADAARLSSSAAYAAPETELQRQIEEIWNHVLGINNISIDSSFFNIGGHSLLATQVVSRISDSLNFDIPLRLMFEKPTIRSFAEAIAALQTSTSTSKRNAPRLVPVGSRNDSEIDVEQLTDEQVDALITNILAKGGAS